MIVQWDHAYHKTDFPDYFEVSLRIWMSYTFNLNFLFFCRRSVRFSFTMIERRSVTSLWPNPEGGFFLPAREFFSGSVPDSLSSWYQFSFSDICFNQDLVRHRLHSVKENPLHDNGHLSRNTLDTPTNPSYYMGINVCLQSSWRGHVKVKKSCLRLDFSACD